MIRRKDSILVSSCLLGQPVRYNGKAKRLRHELLKLWQAEKRLVPICPEVFAGFPTPRPAAEIEPGKTGLDVLLHAACVIDNNARDVTAGFLAGAQVALQIAKDNGCRFALLTDASPSCGSTSIYNGTFSNTRKRGAGVVTACLTENGIRVFPEHKIAELGALLDRV